MFSRKKKTQPNTRPKPNRPQNEFNFDSFGFGGQNTSTPDDEELEAELRALTGGVIGSKPTRKETDDNMGDNDSDLEAELLQLMGGKKRVPQRKKEENPVGSVKEKVNLERLLKNPDFNFSQDHDDEEVDEDDPELLGELNELFEDEDENDEEAEEIEVEEEKEEKTFLSVLQERLQMYKTAEKNAKEAKESARARRFNRGIKTLEGLIKKAEAGQPVLDSEIPPVVATNLKQTAEPIPVAPGLGNSIERKDTPGSSRSQSQEESRHPASFNAVLRQKSEEMYSIGQEEPEMLVLGVKQPEKPTLIVVKTEKPTVFVKEPETPLPIKESEKPTLVVKKSEKPTQVVKESEKPTAVVEVPDRLIPVVKESENQIEVSGIGQNVDKTQDINVSGKQEELEAKEEPKPQPEPENPQLSLLKSRREEYKASALAAKKSNNIASALELVKVVKTLDGLISVAESGAVVSKEKIPPGLTQKQKQDQSPPPKPSYRYKVPTTVMEALEQRLRIYRSQQAITEKNGDANAAKQNTKIVKLYTEVIKLHRAGKPIPIERLPTPAGCPPIPLVFQT